MHAAENLDQRRLAGAVLPDQRMDLAGVQLERDIVQRVDARERLAHPREGEHRRRGASRIGRERHRDDVIRRHRSGRRMRDASTQRLSVAQKLNLAMFALANTCGGPSRTELPEPTVSSPSLPAVNFWPEAAVIFFEARLTAA